jgi:hypothetical protein
VVDQLLSFYILLVIKISLLFVQHSGGILVGGLFKYKKWNWSVSELWRHNEDALTPKGSRIHSFTMANSIYHIVKKDNSSGAKFFTTRLSEERCMCWSKGKEF